MLQDLGAQPPIEHHSALCQVRASATPNHCRGTNASKAQPGRHFRYGESGASKIDTGFPHVLHAADRVP